MARDSEQSAVEMYNRFANDCGRNNDSVSKKLFEDLIADEERHYDQFETQLEHLQQFGSQLLALQSIERARKAAAGPAGAAE